jgi:putative addiction module component (TIGR02574 family)
MRSVTAAEKLLAVALQLPEQERAEIVARLLESLDPPETEGIDEAWAREIERRCAALDSGDAVTSDWNDFRARIERDVFAAGWRRPAPQSAR